MCGRLTTVTAAYMREFVRNVSTGNRGWDKGNDDEHLELAAVKKSLVEAALDKQILMSFPPGRQVLYPS